MGPLSRRARRHTQRAWRAADKTELKALLLEAIQEDPEFAAAVGEALGRHTPKRPVATHSASARQIRDQRLRMRHG